MTADPKPTAPKAPKPKNIDIEVLNPRYEGATFEMVVKAMLQPRGRGPIRKTTKVRRTSYATPNEAHSDDPAIPGRQPGFGDGDIPLPRFEKFESVDVAYHVRLCSDAGYLILRKSTVETKPVIIRMTWCGHKARRLGEVAPNAHSPT